MELHVLLQWALNFLFMGVIAWQWKEAKKPKPLSQTRLPSLNDERTKSLLSSMERMEADTGVKLKEITTQLTHEVIDAKKRMDVDASLQKHHWEKDMQNLKKQILLDMEELKKQWQTEMIESRMQVEQNLVKMRTLCNEAQKLLTSSKVLEFSENPSHEETEIKEALVAFEEKQIPTVRELEDVRARLNRDSLLDLKSVLKEQLS